MRRGVSLKSSGADYLPKNSEGTISAEPAERSRRRSERTLSRTKRIVYSSIRTERNTGKGEVCVEGSWLSGWDLYHQCLMVWDEKRQPTFLTLKDPLSSAKTFGE
jgi:hypothetical protein